MAVLIYYYSTKAYRVPYKLATGFGVMLIATALYYLKPAIITLGFSDLTASFLILVVGLASIAAISYRAVVVRN